MKVVLSIAVLILSVSTVHADIYSYTDSEGVMHFVDTKVERSFKPFEKDLKKDIKYKQQPKKASQRRANYCQEHCSVIEKTGVTVDLNKCYNNCMKH